MWLEGSQLGGKSIRGRLGSLQSLEAYDGFYEPWLSAVLIAHSLRGRVWLLCKNSYVKCRYTGRAWPFCVKTSQEWSRSVFPGCLKALRVGNAGSKDKHVQPHGLKPHGTFQVPEGLWKTGWLHLRQTPLQEAGASTYRPSRPGQEDCPWGITSAHS